MKQTYPDPQHLIVLGGGLDPVEAAPGEFQLSAASTERVITAAAYSIRHELGENAMILCAGGSSPLYDGLGNQPLEESEGFKMASHLPQLSVPESVERRTEMKSNSTMANFINSVEEGLLVPSDYSREFPLGVVTHRNHYMRARIDAWRIGFDWHALRGIHPHEYMENPQGNDGLIHNMGGIALGSIAYAGVRRGDLAALTQRNDRMMQQLSRGFASKRSAA